MLQVALMTSIAGLAIASSATAAVITFTNQAQWNSVTSSFGAVSFTETFAGYSGFLGLTATGATGPVAWTASAPGGLFANAGGSGAMSTDAPMSVLSFSFGPSVQGVAGNFFAALNTGAVISSIISIELDDGTTYLGASTDASSFVGFYSTTSTITSVSISVEADPKFPSLFASVDNLSFAVVPAPGAIAVLGAMGLIVTRRRRS